MRLIVVHMIQLDQTKTSDGKSNFINVLANAVHSRFPDAIEIASDLPTCFDAARGWCVTVFLCTGPIAGLYINLSNMFHLDG